MSKVTAQVADHRCAERIAIGETVEFRVKGDADFRTATMVDFSESGMLLIMEDNYNEGSQFEVRVKENETIFFSVKCVRTSPCPDNALKGYGCQIVEHHFGQ
jgi:hypothetical protein